MATHRTHMDETRLTADYLKSLVEVGKLGDLILTDQPLLAGLKIEDQIFRRLKDGLFYVISKDDRTLNPFWDRYDERGVKVGTHDPQHNCQLILMAEPTKSLKSNHIMKDHPSKKVMAAVTADLKIVDGKLTNVKASVKKLNEKVISLTAQEMKLNQYKAKLEAVLK